MTRWTRWLGVWLGGLALPLWACSSSEQTVGDGDPEPWVIGIYMAADNNLDAAASYDLNEMLAGGVPDNLTLLIFVDRAELGTYGAFPRVKGIEPHSTAKWLEITSGGLTELEDVGEVNTSDPETVRAFIERVDTRDEEHKAIIFWDHGSAFTYGHDETSGAAGGALSMSTLASQFRLDPDDPESESRKVDIVAFDACLMSTLETVHELRHTADIFVGSAELEPGDGWDYSALVRFMRRNPGHTVEDLAVAMVDGYANYYASNSQRAGGLQVTQAAWSTNTQAAFDATTDVFRALAEARGTEAQDVRVFVEMYDAHVDSTFYARSYADPTQQTSWIDIGDFVAKQASRSGAAVEAAANKLRKELEALQIAVRKDRREDSVLAMSAYFPVNLVANNRAGVDAQDAVVQAGSFYTGTGASSLLDPEDPDSLVQSVVGADQGPPMARVSITSVDADEVRFDYSVADDLPLARTQAALLYEVDGGERLAVRVLSPGGTARDSFDGQARLAREAVLIGSAGADPSIDNVAQIRRTAGRVEAPIALSRGGVVLRGVVLLEDDGTPLGVALQSQAGTWSSLAWEDVLAFPGARVAPLTFRVDPATGDYDVRVGKYTLLEDAQVRRVALEDASRLTVLVAATDLAGAVTVDVAPVN